MVEPRRIDVRYVEQPCKSAVNPVKGMGFKWSLNPYMGCEHRCAFCYVRAYEKRADRPSDDAYGRAVRVKTNVAQVLRWELSRPGWRRETGSMGAATDPYQPAEGRHPAALPLGAGAPLAGAAAPLSGRLPRRTLPEAGQDGAPDADRLRADRAPRRERSREGAPRAAAGPAPARAALAAGKLNSAR